MRQLRFVLLGCAMVVAGSARAGFFDKRADATPVAAPQSVVPVAASVTTVSGYSQSSGWAKPAPEYEAAAKALGAVKLSDAVFLLLPEGHPSISLDSTHEILARRVQWKDGSTRIEALMQIAADSGVNIAFTGEKPGSKVWITKADAAAPAMAAPAVPAASGPTAISAAPAAAPTLAAAGPRVQPGLTVLTAESGASSTVPADMKTFEVRLADITLNRTLQRWAVDNGVRVRWDADRQLVIGAPDTVKARSVLEAIDQLLMTPGIRNGEYPLEACEYPNQPPLIRITRQGEQAKDCPGVK